jgi:protein-arginine kinase activator protein McsA
MSLCERCGEREAVQEITIEVNDDERTIMVCQRCAEALEQEREESEEED